MTLSVATDRQKLVVLVWAVLVSQVLLYPGLEDIIDVFGGGGSIKYGMWFLVAEFAAFILFATVWGVISDVTGKRVPWIVIGALGGASVYITLVVLAGTGISFEYVLSLRFIGGALTIGAFSLGITMLMDLSGGSGKNMGAAGIAIGLGAAMGSVIGGQLSTIDPLGPLYGSAGVLVVVGIISSTLIDHSPDTRPALNNILDGVKQKPILGVVYSFGFIDRLTAGFFSLVGVWYFRDVFGADAALAGLTLALFFTPFALLQYPFGALSDKYGRYLFIVGGSVLYGFTIIILGLAQTYVRAAILMFAIGVCGALMAPATMALVNDLVEPEERGIAMGGFNVFGSLGFLTGFLLGGTLVTTLNYTAAFIVIGMLEIAIVFIAGSYISNVTETRILRGLAKQLCSVVVKGLPWR